MTIKTCKTAVRASAILAAITLSGGAFGAGASGDSYTFEGGTTLGSGDLAGLTGNGTVVEETISSLPAVGRPLTDSGSHVLEIAGTVAYTNDTTSTTPSSNASQVDFMFKVEPTDEALEAPGGTDIQVALAVGVTNANGTTAPIQLYCRTASGGDAGWTTIAESATVGSWMRATLVMDYSDNTCKVSLDGNPVLNDGSQKFFFACATPNQSFVKSITMVGSTRIDDLKVSYDANYAIPGGDTAVSGVPAGSPVTYGDLNKYGITVEQAVADNDVSGCGAGTISEKLTAGLDPTSPTKFELKTMTPTSATAATVTFPGNDATYTVKVTVPETSTTTTFTTIKDAGMATATEKLNSVDVTLPADKLAYITVEATK